MFSYSDVENAMFRYFHLEEAERGSLGGRIRNLQKLGLKPESPGRGNRISYTLVDICDLAIALSLTQLGANPSAVAGSIRGGDSERAMGKKGLYLFYIPNAFGTKNNYIVLKHKHDTMMAIDRIERAMVINVGLLVTFIRQITNDIMEARDVSA